MLRLPLRLILLSALILGFLLLPVAPARRVSVMCRASRRGLRLLGVRLCVHGHLAYRTGLVVANHLSWLDPLVLASVLPSGFVTSTDIGADPFLGRICAKGGCLFVDRHRRRAVGAEHALLADMLQRQLVTVFPEATSSNGDGVLPFRSALFESARLSRQPVLPLMLRYRALDGRPLTRRSRDRVHWYGSMAFAPHLCGLLRVARLDVDIQVLPRLCWSLIPDRKLMARQAHALIQHAYVQAASG